MVVKLSLSCLYLATMTILTSSGEEHFIQCQDQTMEEINSILQIAKNFIDIYPDRRFREVVFVLPYLLGNNSDSNLETLVLGMVQEVDNNA